MKKITSFCVDHTKLNPGIYISRIDGDIVTYDLRVKKPNTGDLMDNVQMHTTEHMFATFVRNSTISENIIYFGPMGCQTGFYLLVNSSVPSQSVVDVCKNVLADILEYDGDVFGASEIECGNYKSLSLDKAKETCSEYLNVLKKIDTVRTYDEI